MKILLKIVLDLMKDIFKLIGIFIAFIYVFSAFGLLFAMSALEVILGSPSNSLVFMISITFFILIVISWAVLAIRWFQVRIKQEINNKICT